MRTLKELNYIECLFITNHGGVSGITEFDQEQNTISRNKIRAYKNEFGVCYLGKINKYDNSEPILEEYIRGIVYNFEYDFAIPEYNSEIAEMIEQYNKPKEQFNSKHIMNSIKDIYNKIDELNGIFLRWV